MNLAETPPLLTVPERADDDAPALGLNVGEVKRLNEYALERYELLLSMIGVPLHKITELTELEGWE